MTHECDKILLVAVCCFVEILLITASDPPLDECKFNDIYKGFIEQQLSVLVAQDDPMEAFQFPILEQLGVIKAFVIFADNGHVAYELFACLYYTARAHQSPKVRP